MKKILLFSAPALILSGTVMAQTNYKAPVFSDKNVTKVMAKTSKYAASTGFETGTGELRAHERTSSFTMVGTSTYQLQSNAAVQNRIVANADGTISAGYTFSNTSGWADRGTGYVYNNSSSWSAAPTTRIESVRTGWPSVMVLGDNSEVVICHSATNLYMSKRAVKGTGAWTGSSTIIASTAAYGSVWPRAINGGNDGKSIHMISLTNPTDGAATPTPVYYHGQQGCLTYSRSQDGGVTWDKLHTVPHEHDSTFYRGFGGDSYAIDAKGTTIAYVVGGALNDLFLMKSMDNGSTWTKTNIMTFPIPFFQDQLTDTNSDGTIDTLNTNDGTVSLLIDEVNTVHVMFGRMRILNDDSTDGQYSYFPGTSGIMYWNDNTQTKVQIADLEDVNGNGVIDLVSNGWGTYQNSLTSFTSMGIDASHTIHATYAGLVEGTDPLGGGKAVRNIYYFASSDHGATWGTPVRINANDIREQVWSSVARNAQATCVKMIYQEDDAPGHGTTSTNADYSDNQGVTAEEYYACFDPSNGILETVKLSEGMSLYPNPANTEFTVTTINSITKVEIFNSLGNLVATHTPNSTSARINVNNLSKGLYVVNVYNGNQKISKMLAKD